tara:strand:- start:59 stop:997 length:939 start_codon:yes stop_codon:yes gene_type:complete
MLAVIFPGQGSQTLGMIKDFFENFPTVRNIFEKIKASTDIDVYNIIFEDSEKKLNITEFTQICIYTASISIFMVIKEIYGEKFLNKIKFVAGHSLGEYTALSASDTVSLLDCAKLLKLRGKYMQDSYPENLSGMLAVIGLNINSIENILSDEKEKNLFEIANHNGLNQVVLSLKKEDFNLVSSKLKKHGAKKTVPLNVSAGFHSSFMKKASENMIKEIDKLVFNNSKYPIISNYSANPVQDSIDIMNNLKKQMLNQVKWVDTIKFLENNNVENILEIGPNNVLNGLNKRISNKFILTNVSNIQELEDLKNVL